MATANSTTSLDVRAREVLQLWLRWNEESQQLTARMFAERDNSDKLQQMLDDVDRLRMEAVAASQEILKEDLRT
jgi:hypothetical protein